MWASRNGHEESVRALIEKGACLETVDEVRIPTWASNSKYQRDNNIQYIYIYVCIYMYICSEGRDISLFLFSLPHITHYIYIVRYIYNKISYYIWLCMLLLFYILVQVPCLIYEHIYRDSVWAYRYMSVYIEFKYEYISIFFCCLFPT
jgi:hypothetical protein